MYDPDEEEPEVIREEKLAMFERLVRSDIVKQANIESDEHDAWMKTVEDTLAFASSLLLQEVVDEAGKVQ